jgi:two-component system response regulator AtoC
MEQQLLIVDDEENMRHMLSAFLRKHNYEADMAENGADALKRLRDHLYDVVLCDIRMPEMDGMTFLKKMAEEKLTAATVIMMSAYGTIDDAVEAMKMGAYDYVSKPFKPDEILLALKKAEERERLRRENLQLRRVIKKEYSFENIIAKSAGMHRIFEAVRKVADYRTTVLITGESGTGKELIAKAIHYHSDRATGPFVAINCGAIPDNLLESELFGHVKGAFTDATRNKKGLFEEADGGTLLLDEIGELPKFLQVKILRVLQDSEIRRVGDTKTNKVDVRIIAATVKDLAREVSKNAFREDLYYRLNVIPIHLPPLRDRREDIPLLVQHFIKKCNEQLETRIQGIASDAISALMDYAWMGNVRELENTIERAMVLSETDHIRLDQLPDRVLEGNRTGSQGHDEKDLSIKKAARSMERDLITKALEKTQGNRTHAARLLEISHRTLLYKIEEYEIQA